MAQHSSSDLSEAEIDLLGAGVAAWILAASAAMPRRIVLEREHLLIGRDVAQERLAEVHAKDILFHYFAMEHESGLSPTDRVNRLEETLVALCLYLVDRDQGQNKFFHLSLVRDFVRILRREGRIDVAAEAGVRDRVLLLLIRLEKPWALSIR